MSRLKSTVSKSILVLSLCFSFLGHSQLQNIDFEEIYDSSGTNYSAGTYDVGQDKAYSFDQTGEKPLDRPNAFNAAVQGSDDGIRFEKDGQILIDFVEEVANVYFSISDIEFGPNNRSVHEEFFVYVYDINNNLLRSNDFIASQGIDVFVYADDNHYDGNGFSERNSDQDPNGTLTFDFGNTKIDRIIFAWDIEGNASLRMTEPRFRIPCFFSSDAPTLTN